MRVVHTCLAAVLVLLTFALGLVVADECSYDVKIVAKAGNGIRTVAVISADNTLAEAVAQLGSDSLVVTIAGDSACVGDTAALRLPIWYVRPIVQDMSGAPHGEAVRAVLAEYAAWSEEVPWERPSDRVVTDTGCAQGH